MKQQILVQYDNSDDAMYGRDCDMGTINQSASESKFEHSLAKALNKHFRGAEITITTGPGRYSVDGDTDTDAAEAVGVIVNRVWETFDWLVEK